MTYAKLIEGELVFAPNPILVDCNYIGNPLGEIYEGEGYKAVQYTDPPATGAYSIVFTSGSTATSTTFPATILGLESFAAEANTMYEINVLDNRAVVGSWAVSSS